MEILCRREINTRGGIWQNVLMTGIGISNIDVDDDDSARRPQRRKYEEPQAAKLRKQLLVIAESVSSY